MIGVNRTLKQKAGRFRKKVIDKLKQFFWHRKKESFDEMDENWDD